MKDPIGWFDFEVAWRQTALAAMIPSTAMLPSASDLDLRRFWTMFHAEGTKLFRLGFRLSVWVITVRTWLRHRSVSRKHVEDTLVRMNAGSFISRQLVVALKVVATLAYFSNDDVRGRFL